MDLGTPVIDQHTTFNKCEVEGQQCIVFKEFDEDCFKVICEVLCLLPHSCSVGHIVTFWCHQTTAPSATYLPCPLHAFLLTLNRVCSKFISAIPFSVFFK